MATFKSFEDIQAWQKARRATKLIYEMTNKSEFVKDFGLRDQIRRSSVSVMANIAEGNGRLSDKEFANFLNIARGSVSETQSHLYIAFDLKYIEQNDFNEIYKLLEEISKMLVSLGKHLRAVK